MLDFIAQEMIKNSLVLQDNMELHQEALHWRRDAPLVKVERHVSSFLL